MLLNCIVVKNESGEINIEGEEDISSLFDKNGISIKSNSGDATLITYIKFKERANILNLQINGVSK